MINWYDLEPHHGRYPPATYDITARTPVDIYQTINLLIQQYGGADQQMYLTLNELYKTHTYRATAKHIRRLMVGFWNITNYRNVVIHQLTLTITT